MSESAATLRVEGVTKKFGDFTAVDELSFEVRPGRVFGFLGPNGAGKTTTIRMIVGITKPDTGRIEYGFQQGYHPAAEAAAPLLNKEGSSERDLAASLTH